MYFGGIGLAAGLLGFSANFALFFTGMLLLGTAASIYHVAGSTLISHRTVKTGRSFGIHGIAGSGGVTLAPLIAGLMSGGFGWRYAYLILIPPALIGFYFTFKLEEPRADDEKNGPTANSNDAVPNGATRIVIILLMATVIINGFIYRAVTTAIPMHLSEGVSGIPLPEVVTGGMLASLVLAFGMAGMYVLGNVADRADRFRIYAMLFAVVVPTLAIIGLTQGIALLLASIVFAAFYFPSQPIENTILATCMPPRYTSFLFGIKFGLAFGLGSLGAVTAGYVTEIRGTGTLFLILATVSIISLTLTVTAAVLWRHRR